MHLDERRLFVNSPSGIMRPTRAQHPAYPHTTLNNCAPPPRAPSSRIPSHVLYMYRCKARGQKVHLVGGYERGEVRAQGMRTIISTHTLTVSPARASPASFLCSPPPGCSGDSVTVSPS